MGEIRKFVSDQNSYCLLRNCYWFQKKYRSKDKAGRISGQRLTLHEWKGSATRPGHFLEEAFYDPETKTWFGVSDENPLIAKEIQSQGNAW
jgi:hypothetical protein